MVIDRYVTTEEVRHFQLNIDESYVNFFNDIYRHRFKNWVNFTYEEFIEVYCSGGTKKANFSDSEWEEIVDLIHSYIDEDLYDNFDAVISSEEKLVEDEVTLS